MSVIAKTKLGVNLWLNIFCYVDERLNGPVHWLARRGKMCDGRAPHPLRLLAVAAEPAFADDADVDALLGQKRFQFVDAT